MHSDQNGLRSPCSQGLATMGCWSITLGLCAMAMACSEDGSVSSGVGVGGEAGHDGSSRDDACEENARILSAQLTKNDSGLFVQLEVQPEQGLLTPLESQLYLHDGRKFSLLSRELYSGLDGGVSNPGLWALSSTEVLVSGQNRSCTLELLDAEDGARRCVLGLLQSPTHMHVASDERATLTVGASNNGEQIFQYDGEQVRAFAQLDPSDSNVGFNGVNGLWADEETIYVTATSGVYLAGEDQRLERILVPPDPPPGGQFVVGGIYAKSTTSVWVIQYTNNRSTIEHYDGETWTTAWPTSQSAPEDPAQASFFSNKMWGAGSELYFISSGVLYKFSSGTLEPIVGEQGDGGRKVFDMWGVASDEIYLVTSPSEHAPSDDAPVGSSSGSCPYVELQRFDGTTLRPF